MHYAKNGILVLTAALGVVACAKEERPAEPIGTTMTTRGQQPPAASAEEVRAVMLERRPGEAETINALVITSENGIVTVRGRVDDEATHSDLVNRVRSMPNVRGVRDEIRVAPKGAPPAAQPQPETGQPHGQLEQPRGQTVQPQPQPMSRVDAVRKSMRQSRPMADAVIERLTIEEDGDTVTVTGIVPDETTRQSLLRAARETSGVKHVKDDLKVEKPKK